MDFDRTTIIRAVLASRVATADLVSLLGAPRPSIAKVRDALARGAFLGDVSWTVSDSAGIPGSGRKKDVWERLLEIGSVALFSAVIDAAALEPVQEAVLLARSAEAGNVPFVQALLARGVDPNEPIPADVFMDWGGMSKTALVSAVMSGQDGALDVLLAAGADPFAALGEASGADGDSDRFNPRTLLHLVKTPHAVRVLVARGLKVDEPDCGGRSPLEIVYTAVNMGRDAQGPHRHQPWLVADALLDAGASTSLSKQCLAGSLPGKEKTWHALEHLYRSGSKAAGECVRRLSSRGVAWPSSLVPRTPAVVAWLLANGVDLDVTSHGRGWLRQWLENEGWPVIGHAKDLARLGIDLDSPYPDGKTAFVLALQSGDSRILACLLDAGASPDGLLPCPAGGLWRDWLTVLLGEYDDDDISSAMQDMATSPEVAASILEHAIAPASPADEPAPGRPRL